MWLKNTIKNLRSGAEKILVQRYNIFSTLLARAQLAARLGQQYGGDRDVYQALGYKEELTYDDFAAYYDRHELARAIIDRPVNATWQGEFGVQEAEDETETPLEKAWNELSKQLSLKSRFVRLDKLTGIGSYGVLLFGLDDVKTQQDFAKPVENKSQRKLLYLKSLGEGAATIQEWDRNTSSDRYGQPVFYNVTIKEPGGSSSSTIRVHHTRVLHVTEGLLESETEGTPRLQAVYNRLMDLEKLVGGSAEMFWRGARPGYQGKLDKDFTMTTENRDALKEQIDDYEHNLRRLLITEGVGLESLAQQIADPSQHVDIQIQMISAETGIPKRILTGSERGELASTEDRENWLALIDGRRDEYAEPKIVRPFVDYCIEHGILPKPKTEYSIYWEDLWSQSDKEKADIGKTRAEALVSYVNALGAMDVMPPKVFYEHFLGMDEEQIKLIEEERKAAIQEDNLEKEEPP